MLEGALSFDNLSILDLNFLIFLISFCSFFSSCFRVKLELVYIKLCFLFYFLFSCSAKAWSATLKSCSSFFTATLKSCSSFFFFRSKSFLTASSLVFFSYNSLAYFSALAISSFYLFTFSISFFYVI